jgi:putative membrane protein|tara:strand:- start:3459 stop:4637 length:1179 start_codon:yes stop_codon:yes gene_type:complete
LSRTLVLSIDRDNDLGVKAGIRGPVIGRKATLTAALKLGIADPEESDTNAILGALHHHDRLVERAEGNDQVEIAILTGDVRVGPRSDRAIASQLDEVIQEFQPDSAVLVTDGAEDEASMPIVTSRVRVEHVEKIIVRQSRGIESTYYYVAKAIEDPRWRARLLVPIALFLMILGLGLILPNGGILIGAMPLIIGIWILAKGLGWEQQLDRLMNDMRESATGGIWSTLLWSLSIVSVLLSILTAYQVFYSSTAALEFYVTESFNGINEFNLDAVNRNISVWIIAIDQALTWILFATFSFVFSLGVLRWKEGSFTGQSMLLIGLGVVVYTVSKAVIEVLLAEMGGGDYPFDFTTVSETWGFPVFALIVYYFLRTIVESISAETEEDGSNRYWGI